MGHSAHTHVGVRPRPELETETSSMQATGVLRCTGMPGDQPSKLTALMLWSIPPGKQCRKSFDVVNDMFGHTDVQRHE